MPAQTYRVQFFTGGLVGRGYRVDPTKSLQISMMLQSCLPIQTLRVASFLKPSARSERRIYNAKYFVDQNSFPEKIITFSGNALVWGGTYKTAAERTRHAEVKSIIQGVLSKYPEQLLWSRNSKQPNAHNRFVFRIKGTQVPVLNVYTPDDFTDSELTALASIVDRTGMMSIWQTTKEVLPPDIMVDPVELRFMGSGGEGGCLLHPKADISSMKGLLVSLGMAVISEKLYHT